MIERYINEKNREQSDLVNSNHRPNAIVPVGLPPENLNLMSQKQKILIRMVDQETLLSMSKY